MTIEKAPEIKSVADALDAGIALADAGGKPPEPVADDDDGGTTDDATTDPSATPDGASDGPGDTKDGDPPADAGAATTKDGDGADSADGGDPVDAAKADDADGDGKAPVSTDPKAAKPAGDGKPVAKAKDPLTDPIPNALKPETKERIRTLVDRTKTAEAALTKATEERNELISAIHDTGATPQQYAATLDYLALVNSNDRNKQIQAINFMYRELSALSRISGIRIPGITTISGHADLEKSVAEGKITQELAEELAANRAATAHQGKVGAAQAQASEARQRYAEADKKARADMNALEVEFAKDPLYKAKKPMIVEMLNEMISGDAKQGIPPLHPSKWAAAYKKIYDTLPKTNVWGSAKPGNGQPGGKVPQNQPLRTQQPAGAQKKEPKSVAEALEMGIEMARGG